MFRRQKIFFSARDITLVTVAFLMLFAGIYGYDLFSLYKDETSLSRIDHEIDLLRDRLDEMVDKFPQKTENKLLQSEISRLGLELEKRKQIQNALAQHSLENKRIFSAMLESLARKHVQGTWLTKVSITEGGESVGFAGKTYSSELVPVYIQNLSLEESFAGLSFNVLELNRSEQDPLNLDFQVRTKPGRL